MVDDIAALIARRRRQFLIHSFLYYHCDETLISDADYDRICRELCELQRAHPDLTASLPYHDICSRLDASGSGYYIREYPPEIVSKAIHLLAHSRGAPVEQVAAQFGMRILGREEDNNRAGNANERKDDSTYTVERLYAL